MCQHSAAHEKWPNLLHQALPLRSAAPQEWDLVPLTESSTLKASKSKIRYDNFDKGFVYCWSASPRSKILETIRIASPLCLKDVSKVWKC